MTSEATLLSVRLSAGYRGRPDVLRGAAFEMNRGEILGLAGQSGAGKSTITLAILNLLTGRGGQVRGEILFEGRDLLRLSQGEMRRLRGKSIALVPQNPLGSLNPALTVRSHILEFWKAHSRSSLAQQHMLDLLESVSLPADPRFLDRYPRELSVGLAQRVLIALAILHRPPLILADEPTSALDVITQSEILKLFQQLNRILGIAILYVSHDLLSMLELCSRLAILHEGEIVEAGPAREVVENPSHPYTRRLMAALPGNGCRHSLTSG